MIDNIISTIGFELSVFMLIIILLILVGCWLFICQNQKTSRKIDKQMAVLDAYIDSVAKANDLITVSLPINNGKIYEKLIKKLQRDFEELHKTIKSVKGIEKINHNNFTFSTKSCWDYPMFRGKEIYDFHGWSLSPSETLSLMKEWPEAKLQILRMHKQNILEFNAKVAEISSLVQRNIT